jgi:general secretion pathway protein A
VYLRFYGLREKPFNPTPDPRFLYLTTAHREALAQLEYGVKERRGFIVLTGEVGTGKTTLLRTLLDRLESTTECAFVFNSMMSFDEILAYVVEDFGIVGSGNSHAHRLVALNHYLTERVRRGLNTVLIIDEAQNLDAAALEQVRLLSNFETTNEKLLQILLVGQPELKAKLALPELRQLKQRIGLRCSIHPLSPANTAEYIHHRLAVAGQGDPTTGTPALEIFTRGAVERICAYSGGIPRVVNLVCDHCLLVGYADQKRVIDVRVAEEAIDYLEERETLPSAPPAPERPPSAERPPKSAESPPKSAESPPKSAESPPKSSPQRRPKSPEVEREVIVDHQVPENTADPLEVAQRFSPEVSDVEVLTAERLDRWDPHPEGSSRHGELSDRWLVSAAMAAAVGSAVFLALEPNGALGLVGQLASSLEDLGVVARDLLGRLVIGSRAASF